MGKLCVYSVLGMGFVNLSPYLLLRLGLEDSYGSIEQ
jgi:hypothetical protein